MLLWITYKMFRFNIVACLYFVALFSGECVFISMTQKHAKNLHDYRQQLRRHSENSVKLILQYSVSP